MRLLASPERYHAKQVQVTGFVSLEFEGDAIYLHREDYERMLMDNALWINVPPELYSAFEIHSPGYAIVVGTVDANSHGHLGMFSGTIGVSRLDPAPSRSEIDAILREQKNQDFKPQ